MPTNATTPITSLEETLCKIKRTDFMTHAVKKFFPDAKHKLLISLEATDDELGLCYERIGYFFLPRDLPIIYTHAKISLSKTKKELIHELKQEKKPFGVLLRDHYTKSKIKSQTISFEENVTLPDYYDQTVETKHGKPLQISRHERYIWVDNEKIAKAIEYI